MNLCANCNQPIADGEAICHRNGRTMHGACGLGGRAPSALPLCSICLLPLDDIAGPFAPTRRVHVECQQERDRERMASALERSQHTEARKQAGELAMARLVAVRHERAANVETLREMAAAEREAGLHATMAATRDAHAQRAAALELAATKIEEGP